MYEYILVNKTRNVAESVNCCTLLPYSLLTLLLNFPLPLFLIYVFVFLILFYLCICFAISSSYFCFHSLHSILMAPCNALCRQLIMVEYVVHFIASDKALSVPDSCKWNNVLHKLVEKKKMQTQVPLFSQFDICTCS